jgi:hypothetical protein
VGYTVVYLGVGPCRLSLPLFVAVGIVGGGRRRSGRFLGTPLNQNPRPHLKHTTKEVQFFSKKFYRQKASTIAIKVLPWPRKVSYFY